MENIENGLKEFGQDFVLSLAFVLRNLDKRASGKLISSLNYRLVTLVQNVNYQIEIYGASHFKFVNEGRNPGKQPPLNKIQQWCKINNIPVKAAYPIAQKIGRFGIPPTNALQTALKQIDFVALEKSIDKIVLEEIKKQLKEAA